MFDEKYLNFHFPLFTTCLHMLVQFCLATLVLYFIPRLRPRSDSITNPHNHYHVRRDAVQDEKPLMTKMFYLTRIGPCGAATGLDIGLGNMSLKFITLTFYSMFLMSFLLSNSVMLSIFSSNVQILLPSVRPHVGLPLPSRIPLHKAHSHHRNNDSWCNNDGCRRSSL